MYKNFKITKRISVSFETFRKSAKKIITIPSVYHTGIYKSKDEINGINFYFLTINTFRVVLIVEDKIKCGICNN